MFSRIILRMYQKIFSSPTSLILPHPYRTSLIRPLIRILANFRCLCSREEKPLVPYIPRSLTSSSYFLPMNFFPFFFCFRMLAFSLERIQAREEISECLRKRTYLADRFLNEARLQQKTFALIRTSVVLSFVLKYL